MPRYFVQTSLYPSWDREQVAWGSRRFEHAPPAILFFESDVVPESAPDFDPVEATLRGGPVPLEEALEAARVIFPDPDTVVQCRRHNHGWLISPQLSPAKPRHNGRVQEPAVYVRLHEQTRPAVVDLDDLYEACTELPRLMGNCPCSLADTPMTGGPSPCARAWVLPHLDVPLERLEKSARACSRDVPPLPERAGNFERISARYLNRTGWGPGKVVAANGAWLNDLDCSENHIQKARDKIAKAQEARVASRRFGDTECTRCVFQRACAPSLRDRCSGAKSQETVHAHLTSYLSGPVTNLMKHEGFTREQRDFLLREAGTEEYRAHIRKFSSRATWASLSGFGRRGEYVVRAARRDRTRREHFTCWSHLCDALPELDAKFRSSTPDPVPDDYLLTYCAMQYRDRMPTGVFGASVRLMFLELFNDRVYAHFGNRSWLDSRHRYSMRIGSPPSELWDYMMGEGTGFRIP